jgi:tetratricopeptide (TPR) repeat protein
VKTALSILLAASICLPGVAGAQLRSPALVEEDLSAEGDELGRVRRDVEPEPLLPPGFHEHEVRPARQAKPPPGASARATASAALPPAAGPVGTTGGGAAPLPPAGGAADPAAQGQPPAPASPRDEMVRSIQPVQAVSAELFTAWHDRRSALREQKVAVAREAERRLLSLQEELGIENLRSFAAAVVRESGRALAARVEIDAVAHAELAVRLAPDLPEAHLALARARFARSPASPMPALSALGGALAAAARDPQTSRAFLGDVAAAALAALLAASGATLFVLLARRFRLFLHDFHDLPVVRSGTPVQGALLAVALLAVPLALGLGPFVLALVATLAAWLYLDLRERLVATAALLVIVAMPHAVERVARETTFTGTIAEDVYHLEHGHGDEAAARLTALAERGELPAPALSALGTHAKRRGDLGTAQRWFAAAIDSGGRDGEVLVNLGNVHLLRGDSDAAKAAWLDAADRAAGNLQALAAAHYNLSKLYVREATLDQAHEARKRALAEDATFVRRRASEDDFRANRYLVDVPLTSAHYRQLTANDPAPAALREAVRARLAGTLPRPWWPAVPLGLVAALWVIALAGRGMRPSRSCDKCGRPACARCDGATGLLCGQCLNVFVKKNVVEARDRARKELQVRRHASLRRIVARAAAAVGGGAGHLVHGHPVKGALLLATFLFAVFLVVFRDGVAPPPQPAPLATLGRLAVAVPLAIAVHAFAMRDLFRRTRG